MAPRHADIKEMDVALIRTYSIDRPTASTAGRPNDLGGDFAASMAAEMEEPSAVLERAEGLIGTRIRAPEGGCGCDALVGTVAPSPARTPSTSAERSQAQPTIGSRPVMARTGNLFPGRILVIDEPSGLSDHIHRAILRNATEMITANRDGLVEVLSIPWERVQQD